MRKNKKKLKKQIRISLFITFIIFINKSNYLHSSNFSVENKELIVEKISDNSDDENIKKKQNGFVIKTGKNDIFNIINKRIIKGNINKEVFDGWEDFFQEEVTFPNEMGWGNGIIYVDNNISPLKNTLLTINNTGVILG